MALSVDSEPVMTTYDEDADVLYIRIGAPRTSYAIPNRIKIN